MENKMSGIIMFLLLIVVILFATTFLAYEENDKFFDFPIPKRAELISDQDGVAIYNWSQASEENGIPFIYELVIKFNKWNKVNGEGASTYYEKDKHRIDLISQTDQITLRKEK